MPRSYSFDHFTSLKPDPSKLGATGDHPHPLKSETPLPEQDGLHYGRQHAQTVERARARRMDREARQLVEGLIPGMDEQPPGELSENDETQETPQAAKKRVPIGRKRVKRAEGKRAGAAKRERHTPVARRSPGTRQEAGTQGGKAPRPARKATRGTKKVATRSSTLAKTGRGGRKAPAKSRTTRGTTRRPKK